MKANDWVLSAQEGLLGGSASDEGIHPSNDRERPTEVAAPDGGERSARAAREARLVLYGLAQEGLGAVYVPRYVPAGQGVTEGGVGGNKVSLGLGEAPAATRGPIGFLLEREEGFLGKIIYVAPHRFLRKILTRVARREIGDQSHVGGSSNEGTPTVRKPLRLHVPLDLKNNLARMPWGQDWTRR